jgi:hypothetical protein
MRRALVRLVQLAVIVLGSCVAAPAFAQDTVVVGGDALAITFCGSDGQPHSWINMAMLDSAQLVEEIAIHEASHRVDIRQAPKDWCGAEGPTVRTVLLSEVQAYCISDRVAIKYGQPAETVYGESISTLLMQFRGLVPVREIAETWFRGCPAAHQTADRGGTRGKG